MSENQHLNEKPKVFHSNVDSHSSTTFAYSFRYCSSDSFSADTAPSNATGGWHFRGKRILTGAIDVALQLGLATASQVLISGCSAGGVAVIANLDYVVSMLPALEGRVVKGHSDAGWMMDATPMIPLPIDLAQILILGQPFWGGVPNEEWYLPK